MTVLKNARHEKFAIGLVDGLSQEKAYIAAGFSPKGARGSASTLLKQFSNILKRRDELLAEREKLHAVSTAEACKTLRIDKEFVITQLIQNHRDAKKGEPILNKEGEIIGYRQNIQASNRALELLGKQMGMFMGRSEPDPETKYTDIEELRERVRQRSLKLGLLISAVPRSTGLSINCQASQLTLEGNKSCPSQF